MNKQRNVVSFDSIRGRVVDFPLPQFSKLGCYGQSQPELAVYQDWNMRNAGKSKREYHSRNLPRFQYMMDAIGNSWLTYNVLSNNLGRNIELVHFPNYSLAVLIPMNRKTEKDLANNRVNPHDLFFTPGMFLVDINPSTYHILRQKTVDGRNLPSNILPEKNKTVAQIGWEEIHRIEDLIFLQTGGRLTYDYIAGLDERGSDYDSCRLRKVKLDGEIIQTDQYYDKYYYLQKNKLALGYSNGKWQEIKF